MSPQINRTSEETKNCVELAHTMEKKTLVIDLRMDSLEKELDRTIQNIEKQNSKIEISILKINENINNIEDKLNEFISKINLQQLEWGRFVKISYVILGGVISLGFGAYQLFK